MLWYMNWEEQFLRTTNSYQMLVCYTDQPNGYLQWSETFTRTLLNEAFYVQHDKNSVVTLNGVKKPFYL